MTSVAEVLVQPTNDPNAMVYHTRFELSSESEMGMRGCLNDVGEFGSLILKIRGIVQVFVNPYLLLVVKSPAFNWVEIDPNVQDILKMFAISQRQIEDALANPAPSVVDRV